MSLEIQIGDLEIQAIQGSYDSLVIESVPLDAADLELLVSEGPARSTQVLKHIRAYHHLAALRLATGEKAGVVAAALSLSPQTISRLMKDEQFCELIETYRGEVVKKTVDQVEMLGLVTLEAVTAIHEKLIGDDRDDISLESLRRIAETGLDRIGHSPVRRSESFNRHEHDIGSTTLEHIKSLHKENATYIPPPSPAAQLEADHKAEAEAVGAGSSIIEVLQPAQVEKPEGLLREGAVVREQSGKVN